MNESAFSNDNINRSTPHKDSVLAILRDSFERLKYFVVDINSSNSVFQQLRILVKKDNSYALMERDELSTRNKSINDYQNAVERLKDYIQKENDRLSRLSDEERDSNYEREWREFVRDVEEYVRSNQHLLDMLG